MLNNSPEQVCTGNIASVGVRVPIPLLDPAAPALVVACSSVVSHSTLSVVVGPEAVLTVDQISVRHPVP